MLNFDDDYQVKIEKKIFHPREFFQKSLRCTTERNKEKKYFPNVF